MFGKKLVFILLCLAACCVLGQAAYAFSIDPARIELNIGAGRQKGAMITVDNSQSDEPLHLKAYLQDIIYLPSGDYDFPQSASTSWSCANWIKIIPEEIDVPPRRKGNARISVAVPDDAKGGYYAMVFFESSPSYTAEGLGINFRIGALVDVTVANTESRKAELTSMSFIGPKKVEVDIFNQGNVLIRPKGKLKILDAQGKKRIKQLDFNPQAQSILPNTLRKFYIGLDTPLPAGSYRVKAEIDYGTRYLLVGELAIDVR